MNGYLRTPSNNGSFAAVFTSVNVPDPFSEVCASSPDANNLRFAVTDGSNYLYSDPLDIQPGTKNAGISLSGSQVAEVNQVLLECYDANGSYLSNVNLEYNGGTPLFTTVNQPFNAASVNSQIGSSLTDYGNAALVIVGAVLVIGIAYLVFRFGWRKIRSFDRSGSIMGFYYWKKPYNGYNRFRSRSWNLKNTA